MTLEMNIKNIKEGMIGEPFRSRKNHVFRFKRDGEFFVAKIYSEDFRSRASREYNILDNCLNKKINVPAPVEFGNGVIIMEYLRGENASDYFEMIYKNWTEEIKSGRSSLKNPPQDLLVLCDDLACWLYDFHRSFDFRTARGDSILRNFIVVNNKIYGLDFEEAVDADPLKDLGDLCAFILALRPVFTEEKYKVVKILSEKYWDHSKKSRADDLPDFIAGSLEYYGRFRSDQILLAQEAERLRREGIN